MASTANLPRIIKDIQGITTQLYEEFTTSAEPITDDNHVLHRFCVKLEYLLQSCMKDKTLLSGSKTYWHWLYDSLKRKRGISDGLKFVRANKEVRTSQGRGRALVRYSLVHHTLADSLQNCLINPDTCMQYLKPNSVLMNQVYAQAFVNALYELNAVNFDLISQGYDLDAAWPTFASKRYPSSSDQWRAPGGRSSSLGSLNSLVSHVTNTSLMMDNPNLRGVRTRNDSFVPSNGPGSSGTPSVDHRVEELVLELNESDQKIQEQQEALNRLEYHAETMAKSATEKQDILARVISDLESRNQSLEEAMGHMTNEFQNREQLWQSKHDEISSQLQDLEQANKSLKSKISLLEEDKRNLEDTVSARMSNITSGFSGTRNENFSDSESRLSEMKHELEEARNEQIVLQKQINNYRSELASVPNKIENEKQALKDSLTAKFEAKKIDLRRKIDSASGDVTSNLVLKLSTVLPAYVNETLLKIPSPSDQVEFIVSQLSEMMNECSNLQRTSSALEQEKLLQQSYDEQLEFKSSKLLEEYNEVKAQRDDALSDANDFKQKLVSANEELQNYKLKLEAALSDHQHTMLELRDENFQLHETINTEKKYRQDASDDARVLQNKLESSEWEFTALKQKCNQLQEELDKYERKENTVPREQSLEQEKLESELSRIKADKENLEQQIQEKEDAFMELNALVEKSAIDITQLQNELAQSDNVRKESEKDVLHLKLQLNKSEEAKTEILTKISQLEEDLTTSLETVKNTEGLLDILQQQAEELKQEKESLKAELNHEKSRSQEKIQQSNAESAAAVENSKLELKRAKDALEDVKRKYRFLAGNLSEKEKELSAARFQLSTEEACMEEEKSRMKKDFDELFGENESRKRMIKNFEKKVENLEKENSDLVSKTSRMKDLEENLSQVEQEKNSLLESSSAADEELVNALQKLENEREASRKLKDESLLREQGLKDEIEELNAVSNELKSKLVQLLQEKDALWKECDELRYLQKLQEEGEQTEGKWMEDQEARYCLHCGTQFSFIVRKHHCRTCGKIFCNNCSKQWIVTKEDGKHERCCLSCLELLKNKLDNQALSPSVKPVRTNSNPTSPVKENHDSKISNPSLSDDDEFATITDEDVQAVNTSDSIYDSGNDPDTSLETSIYRTPDGKSMGARHDDTSESITDILSDQEIFRKKNAEENREAIVLAGESMKVPVKIKNPGTSLLWSFSTDRSIDFQLSYSEPEGENEQILIPRCRCNSHSEPVQGEMLSKKAGIYTFEFDNKFSKFMSKSLKYTLRVHKKSHA